MKIKFLKPSAFLIIAVVALLSVSFFSACEEKDDVIIVEGTVLSILHPCYGNSILISVKNNNIGANGNFAISNDSTLEFQNAIGIPLFYKFDDSTSINYQMAGFDKIKNLTQDGKIKFECKLKSSSDDTLFESNVICPMLYSSPNVPLYVVTKVINYQD